MSTAACPFVWYELMTSDPAAAKAFYAKVVGWDIKDSPLHAGYSVLHAGAAQIGGLMALTPENVKDGVPPNWSGYIGVDDVDAMAKRIQAAGGKVLMGPSDIPDIGRFAVMTDPQGAAFVIFKDSSGMAYTAPTMGTPGTVGWHELHAGDGPSAFAFYAEHFGWSKDTAMDMGPMGVYQLFGDGSPESMGGMMTKMPQQQMPAWAYYFCVEAIDAAVERVKAGGGQVLNGPMEVPGGSWIINAMDPQGAMFSLVAPKR